MVHYLKLAPEPFRAIAQGHKTIESRLFDAKRQNIHLGDIMVFTSRNDNTQTIRTRVIGLHRYQSFKDLFTLNDPLKFGSTHSEWLIEQIRQFYTLEDEQKYGVIGIEFELLES